MKPTNSDDTCTLGTAAQVAKARVTVCWNSRERDAADAAIRDEVADRASAASLQRDRSRAGARAELEIRLGGHRGGRESRRRESQLSGASLRAAASCAIAARTQWRRTHRAAAAAGHARRG